MPRPPIYNGFLHLTPNHHSHGYWRTDEGRIQLGYKDLDPYIDVVRTLERGRFDSLFIADVVGVYDLEYGDGTGTIRAGSQFPENDPAAIVSALGYVTEHLGLAITSNIIQDHPFSFARKLSSLDHYTHGRVGWNIVTSYLSNGFRNFGHNGITSHDERYEWAQEYLDVTYKLWEHSWEDGAVVADAASGTLFDPDKIHTIDHVGPRYKVQGPHIVEPSPQRTPVLFQAGNSTAGREFAVRNAEVTFLPSVTPEAARKDVRELQEQARAAGRAPGSLKTLVQLSTVIGSTEEEARRKQQHLHDNIDFDGLIGFYSGGSGIDFTSIDPETPLTELRDRVALGDHVRSIFRAIVDADLGRGRELTWREYLLEHALLPGRFAGTPEQIADHVQGWVEAGVDGFNVVPITTLGWWGEWVDHVVPVLQARGLAQTEYAEGTLRQKLFGQGDRLPVTHHGRALGLAPALT
ncbi:FMN-dependent oxidoreductase, nitrilotriacetate monooxygenase family [Jatrophihabitans endophyticus]|uniref:FMN-dependent oxidoreductase, nitrilotriacetate monooxygenase family n=1 Tax=Jatrophihabitans endophyticus TaxID=1206085 RepID=A0A1M5DRJ9_9ACTN|nr:NtaA/DmoA family FMN-dependent monooxygenase [Jatrophihabitans endophyticus]SHF69536.1 FMN-dependent oxidoreductase, nitrilotriacetate monooxygenase family [Jatrophihabitans endophyticus]